MNALLEISTASDPEVRDYVRTLRGSRKQRRKWEASDQYLARVFGIDAEGWARLYEAQNGCCAGCLRVLRMDRTTHVDHCHKTDRVRGLLCDGCNQTLGKVRDCPETLRRLAAYLGG